MRRKNVLNDRKKPCIKKKPAHGGLVFLIWLAYLLQAPSVQLFTPAHFASQAFA